MKRNLLAAAVTPVAIAVSMAISLPATPALAASSASSAPSGWGAFWRCWWDRDLKGDGHSFTGGCWDRHMGISVPPGTERELKAFQASYLREAQATAPGDRQTLKARYMQRSQSIAQPTTRVGSGLSKVHEPPKGGDGPLPVPANPRPTIRMPGPIN